MIEKVTTWKRKINLQQRTFSIRALSTKLLNRNSKKNCNNNVAEGITAYFMEHQP